MLAAAGGSSPNMSLLPGYTLMAVLLQRGMYVSVLFVEEASRTTSTDVQRIEGEMHAPNGLFTPSALQETRQFMHAPNGLQDLRVEERCDDSSGVCLVGRAPAVLHSNISHLRAALPAPKTVL